MWPEQHSGKRRRWKQLFQTDLRIDRTAAVSTAIIEEELFQQQFPLHNCNRFPVPKWIATQEHIQWKKITQQGAWQKDSEGNFPKLHGQIADKKPSQNLGYIFVLLCIAEKKSYKWIQLEGFTLFTVNWRQKVLLFLPLNVKTRDGGKKKNPDDQNAMTEARTQTGILNTNPQLMRRARCLTYFHKYSFTLLLLNEL